MDSGKLLYEMMKEQDFIAHVRVEEDAFRIQTVKEHSVGTATLRIVCICFRGGGLGKAEWLVA